MNDYGKIISELAGKKSADAAAVRANEEARTRANREKARMKIRALCEVFEQAELYGMKGVFSRFGNSFPHVYHAPNSTTFIGRVRNGQITRECTGTEDDFWMPGDEVAIVREHRTSAGSYAPDEILIRSDVYVCDTLIPFAIDMLAEILSKRG